MKRWLALVLLVFVGSAGWRIGEALSPDALSMAVGVLFGVMAGVPAALLVMAGNRRSARDEERTVDARARQQTQLGYRQGSQPGWGMPYAAQQPVIVVAGPPSMGQPHSAPSQADWFAPAAPARQFNVVGERDALVDEW